MSKTESNPGDEQKLRSGTPRLPESQAAGTDSATALVDTPRIGFLMWVLLAALLVPAAALALLQRQGLGLAAPRVWILALSLPFLLVLLSLPRRYRLDSSGLTIEGLFYRRRYALAQLADFRRLPAWRALLRPGSVFCSDPARALEIARERGMALVISPRRPEEFRQALEALKRPGGVS